MRRFVDAEGVHWRVFEHSAKADRRTTPTLIFESTNVVRRVRTYPANWFELSDGELARLSFAR